MLACDLKDYFIKHNTIDVICLDKQKLDITNSQNVREAFLAYRPDVVIHTAALTDVDYCEVHKEIAYKVNIEGTKNIAVNSGMINAKLVYISSCGLFGDDIKEYSEDDQVVLKTEYSKSKYLGEAEVSENCGKYLIIRPGWLYGGNITQKKNFVYKRYIEALNNPTIKCANDKYGCPTYTVHLAQKLSQLIDSGVNGLFHVTNSGYSTRYQYVKKIIDCFELKNDVIGVDSKNFVRNAPVPDCEILKNGRLISDGLDLLPHWSDALEEFISVLKKNM